MNISNFKGSRHAFKKISEIKRPIHLSFELRNRHGWLKSIHNANVVALSLSRGGRHRNAFKISEKQLRDAMQEVLRCKKIRTLHFYLDLPIELQNSIAEMSQLEEIMMPDNATDATVAHLKNLPNLRKIHVRDCRKFTGSSFRDFAGHPSLEEIIFCDAPVTRENLKQLKNIPHLSRICLTRESDNEDIRLISEISTLTEVSIGHSRVNDKCFQYLAKLKNLKRLSFSKVAITDRFVAQMDQLKNLERFRCSKTFITENSFKSIRCEKLNWPAKEFFKPASREQMEAIYRLIDLDVPIFANYKYGKERSYPSAVVLDVLNSKTDFSKLENTLNQLDIWGVRIKANPAPGTLNFILQLRNPDTQIVMYASDVRKKTVNALKSRFHRYLNQPGLGR